MLFLKIFIFFLSLYALGNVIQQECSQELIMAERRMGSSRGCMPSSHPCPSLPGVAQRAVAPLGAPSVLLKLCPVVLRDICSSRGRREGQAAHKATPAAETLGFMSSWLCQWPLPLPALDGAYKKCWKSQPCDVSSFKLLFNSIPKSFIFPKHQSPPSAMLGEAGLSPKPWCLLHLSALPGGLDTLLGCAGDRDGFRGAVGPGEAEL